MKDKKLNILITGGNGQLGRCLRDASMGSRNRYVFSDISDHLHRNLGKSCLCVSHGSCTIAVHRTKVTMSIYKTVSHGPRLSHVYQRTVN